MIPGLNDSLQKISDTHKMEVINKLWKCQIDLTSVQETQLYSSGKKKTTFFQAEKDSWENQGIWSGICAQ